MIIGVGIDLVEITRIERVLDKHHQRFLQRVYTERELAACPPGKHFARRLAARFAAKEALLKALGTGLAGGIRWRQVEVVRPEVGRPQLVLSGAAAAVAERLGVQDLHLTISHDGPVAAAVVVASGRP